MRTGAPTRNAAIPSSRALRRADELAETFKMLGNANRLKIVVFLAERERSVSEIEAALQIHQPTLSQQLGELRDAGLIRGRRVAKAALYALTEIGGYRALETIYIATGHANAPAALPSPKEGPAMQAAGFASVLTTRGSQMPDPRFVFRSHTQE